MSGISKWNPPNEAVAVSAEDKLDVEKKVTEFCKQIKLRLEIDRVN